MCCENLCERYKNDSQCYLIADLDVHIDQYQEYMVDVTNKITENAHLREIYENLNVVLCPHDKKRINKVLSCYVHENFPEIIIDCMPLDSTENFAKYYDSSCFPPNKGKFRTF